MILEALRQFEDIHTHVAGNPKAVCSLSPSEAIKMSHSDINQPYSIMLHPWYINDSLLKEFYEAVKICSSDSRFVAIGECGLDTNCETSIATQEKCFEEALLTARKYKKPVILHIVKSWDKLIQITNKVFGSKGAVCANSEGCRMIIHGFRKNAELAKQFVDLGYYISLGKKYNPEIPSTIEEDKIYHETDDSAM